MTLSLARRVRAKREHSLQQEKLVLLAKRVKELAEKAFTLKEQAIGARLVGEVDFILALVELRKQE